MANKTDKDNLKQKEIELVVERLEMLPENVYFSSGNGGTSISRDDMVRHIQENDNIGKEFVKTDLEFLRALKEGKLLKQIILSS